MEYGKAMLFVDVMDGIVLTIGVRLYAKKNDVGKRRRLFMPYSVSTHHLSQYLWCIILNLNYKYYKEKLFKRKYKRRVKSQLSALKLLYKRGYGGVKYARQIS